MSSIHLVDENKRDLYLAIDGEKQIVIDTGMCRSTRRIMEYIHKHC